MGGNADEFSSDISGILGGTSESADEGTESDESSGAADGSEGEESGKSSDELLRQMQSERDKAVAERNKAVKALEKSEKAKASPASDGDKDAPASGTSTEALEWVRASKSNYRDQLYDSDPRFAQVGLSRDLITGSTPAEMQKTFESLQGSVDKMTNGIRNSVLQEHGLAPVPAAGERREPVNYETMSLEEFKKVEEKALQDG